MKISCAEATLGLAFILRIKRHVTTDKTEQQIKS